VKTNRNYAMKAFVDEGMRGRKDSQKQNLDAEFKTEMRILKMLSHPNIVKLVQQKRLASDGSESSRSNHSSRSSGDDDLDGQHLGIQKYLVLEAGEFGDLFDFVVSIEEHFAEEHARFLF